jgi:hypothetical protein
MSDNERQLIGISKIARQKVIERLKSAYASDHLDEADFESRLELATNTRNREILKELVEDLPEQPGSSTEVPPDTSDHPAINRGRVRKDETLVGVLSGVTRRGDWQPARRLKVVMFMGGVDLDFSETTIPPEGVDIDVFCLMGGLDIRVPEGINVDARPVSFLGGVDTHGLGGYRSQAPTIRIRGFVMMGGVDIKPPRKNYLKKFIKKMFSDE